MLAGRLADAKRMRRRNLNPKYNETSGGELHEKKKTKHEKQLCNFNSFREMIYFLLSLKVIRLPHKSSPLPSLSLITILILVLISDASGFHSGNGCIRAMRCVKGRKKENAFHVD